MFSVMRCSQRRGTTPVSPASLIHPTARSRDLLPSTTPDVELHDLAIDILTLDHQLSLAPLIGSHACTIRNDYRDFPLSSHFVGIPDVSHGKLHGRLSREGPAAPPDAVSHSSVT